jgi:hypothetical protein
MSADSAAIYFNTKSEVNIWRDAAKQAGRMLLRPLASLQPPNISD